MLDRIERESERLDALIEELLTLHRLEAGALAEPSQRVDIIELLRAIAEDAQFEAIAMGKDVSIEMAGEFTAVVKGELVCRAYENVIRNAVKFSPVGGHVDVKAWADEGSEVLNCTVSDQGQGVQENMLEAIFHPFTRAPGAEAVPGTGLGLAIAKRALALHGGDIKAFSREGGGLTVQIRLPRTSTASITNSPLAPSL